MSRNRFSYQKINVIYQVKDKKGFTETDEEISSDGSSFKGFSDEDEEHDEVEAVGDANSETIFEFSTSKLYRKVCTITANNTNEDLKGTKQLKPQPEPQEQYDLPDLRPTTFTSDIDKESDTSVRPTQNIELFTSDDSQISNDLDRFVRLLEPEIPIAMITPGNEPQKRKRQQSKAIKSNYLSQLQTMMQSNKSKEFFDDLGQVMFPKVSVRLKVQQLEVLFGVHFVTAMVIEYNQLCPNWPPGATLRLVIDADRAGLIKEGSKFLTLIDLFSPPHIVLDAQKQRVPVYLQPGKISLLGD